jgi:NitT/TauT family transport system substrate-binding protein
MKRIAGWHAVLLCGLLLLASGCRTVAGSGKIPLHLGYFPDLTHAVALVGVGSGIFAHALGPHVQLQKALFNAGPAEIEALLAGSIDLAFVGPVPAMNGYIRSHGSALQVIAGACSAGVLFVVRADAGIGSPADLAHKTIADPQRGGTQDMALRHYLQAHHLAGSDQGGNVQIISTSNASILSLFKEGKLDGAWVPQPWATRLVHEARGKVFLDERSLWPGGQFATTIVVVRQAFYRAYPDIVQHFLQAEIDTVEYIRSHQANAEQLVNAQIKAISGSLLQSNELSLAFQGIEFTYDPLVSTINQQADRLYASGFLDSKPDLTGFMTLALLNAALTARGLATVATS